ncbi:hypothetical protein [Streptomyces sp. CA-179760]|uniref:hypothetical protein n=1 Tax=Streptomyces sp. CA-179760 TaxID=3240054 RepID=UPI003D9399D1
MQQAVSVDRGDAVHPVQAREQRRVVFLGGRRGDSAGEQQPFADSPVYVVMVEGLRS